MILTTLIMGITAIAVVSVITAFWSEVFNWVKRAITKVKEIISGVHKGVSVFIKKMREAAKEISKHYSKVGTKWQETIVEKNIQYRDLPEEIRQKVRNDSIEYDISDELSDELELQLNQ